MEKEEEEAMIAATASASQEVSSEFKTLIDSHDLDSLNQLQHLILGRLQDSNAVLPHFNDYSQQCFSEVSTDLSTNTRLLKSMKSDLDYIFLKLSECSAKAKISPWILECVPKLSPFEKSWRGMKSKIKATYPDAFPDNSTIEALDRRPDLEVAQ